MNGRYVLNNREPVECADIHQWARFIQSDDRHVGLDMIGRYRVSTVFLGLDHGFGGTPILFETMIFNGNSDADEWQERCSTWAEAEAMHQRGIEHARSLKHTEEPIAPPLVPPTKDPTS